MPEPKPRPRFQIHLSTAVLLMAEIGSMVFLLLDADSISRNAYRNYFFLVLIPLCAGILVSTVLLSEKWLPKRRGLSLFQAGLLVVIGVGGFLLGLMTLQDCRIQGNEEDAAVYCIEYVHAQQIYRSAQEVWPNKDCDVQSEYAQTLRELYEPTEGRRRLGRPIIAEVMADAEGEPGTAKPLSGYCFKVLTSQGPLATGGERNFIVNGKMTLGYGLIAYPAEYGVTGRRSFMISNEETVYACDLGTATHAVVKEIRQYSPTDSWKAVQLPLESRLVFTY